MYTIVTNNPLVRDAYLRASKNLETDFLDAGGCMEVLERVRDRIHKGARLETHPMAGSVKPNQNPYKTVLVSDGSVDAEEFEEFVLIIENAILTARKFLNGKPLPDWPQNLLEDFMAVDLSLIRSALDRLLQSC